MKRLALAALAAVLAGTTLAAEAAAEAKPAAAQPKKEAALWPAFFAFAEWPETPDLVGFRLTLPWSTKQESVTGIDIGLWGRCRDFEGIACSVFRNDAKDTCSGVQAGLYNTAGSGWTLGVQAGLFNEAGSIRGVQAGVINVAEEARGFQVGLINRAETMYGFQVGAINIIRDAEVPFFPFVNIGF